jgi:hypothetical protein
LQKKNPPPPRQSPWTRFLLLLCNFFRSPEMELHYYKLPNCIVVYRELWCGYGQFERMPHLKNFKLMIFPARNANIVQNCHHEVLHPQSYLPVWNKIQILFLNSYNYYLTIFVWKFHPLELSISTPQFSIYNNAVATGIFY